MTLFIRFLVAALIVFTSGATAQYPMGVIAEDCTATWCGYCPDAYAGLDVMKSVYDTNEFTSVRYYATSGDYGTTETNERISGYYGVGSFPTVIFQGTLNVVGGGATIATGASYAAPVANGIAVPSPFKITINSVNFVTGDIDFDVEVMETLADIGNINIRALLLENDVNIAANYTDLTRDIAPDIALTVGTLGQIQNVVQSFDMDLGWDTAKLWVAVIIQDDDDRSILQSASNRQAPDYSLRFYAKGARAVVGPSDARFSFENFAVFNLGLWSDDIRVTLDPGTLPAGWTCTFTDGVNSYTDYVDLTLNNGESRVFHLELTSAGPGYAMPKIVLTSANLPGVEREIRYNYITSNGLDVLLVDDDGADTYEEYQKDALEFYGATYGVYDRNLGAPTGADLSHFDVVSWQIGFSFPTLVNADRAAIGAYLDGGGKLFISGQDLGWDSWDQGGSAITWYRQYLHTNYLIDDTNRNTLTGKVNDPIGDGVTLNLLGGDGANNNEYPDAIVPYDQWASPILFYDNSNYTAGIKAITPVHRVVYLGFGYEGINNADDRRLLMGRILDWFHDTIDAPEPALSSVPMVRAFPNPAAGAATLSFAIPKSGKADLQIFAPDGSLIRTLARGQQPAGLHSIKWDGRDNAGRPVASGVYFYRLTTDEFKPSGRLILTR